MSRGPQGGVRGAVDRPVAVAAIIADEPLGVVLAGAAQPAGPASSRHKLSQLIAVDSEVECNYDG